VVEIPYDLARFPSDAGSISLKITREVSHAHGAGHFELLVLVDTEFVKGSGTCYIDRRDLAEYSSFLEALDRGVSASWRQGKQGIGLLAEIVAGEALGYSYDEIRVVAVDEGTGVTAGVVAYREEPWLAEAKNALEIFVETRRSVHG